jgi:hypothetical protein
MTTKKFEISGRGPNRPPSAAIAHEQAIERFIDGTEPITTVTVQIPERLKRAYKQAALDGKTTVKALIIEAMEAHLIAIKQ